MPFWTCGAHRDRLSELRPDKLTTVAKSLAVDQQLRDQRDINGPNRAVGSARRKDGVPAVALESRRSPRATEYLVTGTIVSDASGQQQ